MGAMISHMTVLKYDSDYKGLVEIAPVNKDIMNLNTLKIAITAIFKPKQSVLMPFKTEDLTRDKIMGKKLNKDKREIKTASAGLLLGIGIRQLVIPMTIKKIKIPLLMVLAGKDSLGSTPYNIKLFNKFTCDKHLKVYQNSYHALTIDKNREEVFKGIYEWMSKKISD
jgi:esterase/lipase